MRKIVYKIKAHLSTRRRERVFRMYMEYLKTRDIIMLPSINTILGRVDAIIKYLDSGEINRTP